ncbi:MAG: preprotein translocase subunit SecE [Deltaproteobacteria bacterium]|nr:preprotein translocase subunit SecE [Deltaproteobacteria bacterium]
MRQKSTLVALFFLLAGIIVAVVLHLAFATIFGALPGTWRVTNRPILGDNFPLSALLGTVIGLGAGAICFAMARTKTLIGEVIDELNKVNWPAFAETRVNTIVVIVTSVVAAVILGSFDIVFLQLSDWLGAQQITL